MIDFPCIHVLREANYVADWLADFASIQWTEKFWMEGFLSMFGFFHQHRSGDSPFIHL